jgi:2,3-bisphosphoglycerate-independent phosphoglycerate mutase
LGYAPSQYYTGRAPLEAAAQGIELGINDWAIRCNLVTIEQSLMKSFTAGHISSEEAAVLIETLNEKVAPLSPTGLRFYSGVSYRNLAVTWNKAPFSKNTQTFPPHDFTDKNIENALPIGDGGELLRFLMEESRNVFANHPINRQRIEAGKLPATQAWLWGIGQKPQLPLFANRFSSTPIRGAMITAVDLLRGIATLIGWDTIPVPGITGYVDTDFAAKGNYAAEALKSYDMVCVHVEATDEAGHEGSVEKKVKAMEDIDAQVVPPILEALQSHGDWRLFVSPDHPTPVATKTHTSDYVPWLLAGSDIAASTASAPAYNEETARHSAYRYDNGWEMLGLLFVLK